MAYISNQNIRDGSITEADLDAALAAKINAAGSSNVTESGITPGNAAAADTADYATSAGCAGAADTLTGVLGSDLGGAGTVNGILKADGAGQVSAAVAGTDYLTPTGNGSGLTNLNADNLAAGTVADGRLSSNVPLLNAANTFTAAQTARAFATTVQALTDGANIAWNLATGGYGTVTLGGNRTLDNPTNLTAGARYSLVVTQDGGGGRTLGYGSAYKFPGGVAPTLTATANAVDILEFLSDGTVMRLVNFVGDVK